MASQAPKFLLVVGAVLGLVIITMVLARPAWLWESRVFLKIRSLVGDPAALAIVIGIASGLVASCAWRLLR